MIFFETAGQGTLFLWLLGAGFLSGAAYDLLSLLRHRLPRAGEIILDVVWAAGAMLLCTLAMARGGEDRIRGFSLPAMACGGALYALGAGRIFRFLFRKAARRFGRHHDADKETA